MTIDTQRTEPAQRGSRMRLLVPRLLLSLVAPILVFRLVRPYVGSDAVALVICGCVPAAWTIGALVWQRRLDPIGLVAMALFAIAILVSVLSGGSSLPLKLQDSVVTGALGLVCLVSMAVRRPLFSVVMQLMGRGRGPSGAFEPVGYRPMYIATTIIAATLFIHSIAHAIVALTLPTATYLIVARLVGIPLYVAAGALLVWYLRRLGLGRPV